MQIPAVLQNDVVRLERLTPAHVDGLYAAAKEAPALYQLAPVPVTLTGMQEYVARAVADADGGLAAPYAIVAKAPAGVTTETVAGCTRLMNLEWWTWPPGPVHVVDEPRRREAGAPPDVAELGHVWLGAPWVRTAVNTASCLLLITFALETWKVHRLVVKTDERNARSRAAILRLGGHFEGILRAHLPAADGVIRNTAMFSILPDEWPAAKSRLESALTRAHHGAP